MLTMHSVREYKEKILNSSGFNDLDKREQEILNMRFGLKNDSPLTRKEIGKHYGVTSERIRQIEERALWKLKIKN